MMYNRTTMLKLLSLFMVWVLCLNSGYAAKAAAFDAAIQGQVPASQGSALRQELSQVPVGSSIEIRLTNNEKLKGKLGGVSDEGIILKQAKGRQIEERKIAFAEMKSIKTARSTGGRIGLYSAIRENHRGAQRFWAQPRAGLKARAG